MARKEYLCVGKIVGSRGLKGELKAEHYCNSSDVFLRIKKFFINVNENPLDVENMRVYKSHILLKLHNIDSKESAEKLRGKYIYAFRDDIPIKKGSYFIEELKDCNVYNFKTNEFYGVLKDVLNTGANDIYEIFSPGEEKEYLVPIINGTVVNVDLDENKIFIDPIEGIFDE